MEPSTTRWSQLSETVMSLPGTTALFFTTGVSLMAPTARIQASGVLMIAVKSSMPNIPRLLIEKVEPSISSGLTRPARARATISRISSEMARTGLRSTYRTAAKK